MPCQLHVALVCLGCSERRWIGQGTVDLVGRNNRVAKPYICRYIAIANRTVEGVGRILRARVYCAVKCDLKCPTEEPGACDVMPARWKGRAVDRTICKITGRAVGNLDNLAPVIRAAGIEVKQIAVFAACSVGSRIHKDVQRAGRRRSADLRCTNQIQS